MTTTLRLADAAGRAVRIRRIGDGSAVVVSLPEVRGLLDVVAEAETAEAVAQGS